MFIYLCILLTNFKFIFLLIFVCIYTYLFIYIQMDIFYNSCHMYTHRYMHTYVLCYLYLLHFFCFENSLICKQLRQAQSIYLCRGSMQAAFLSATERTWKPLHYVWLIQAIWPTYLPLLCHMLNTNPPVRGLFYSALTKFLETGEFFRVYCFWIVGFMPRVLQLCWYHDLTSYSCILTWNILVKSWYQQKFRALVLVKCNLTSSLLLKHKCRTLRKPDVYSKLASLRGRSGLLVAAFLGGEYPT